MGMDFPWMIGATDVAGMPRIQKYGVDIGAHESPFQMELVPQVNISHAQLYETRREGNAAFRLLSRESPSSQDWHPVGEVFYPGEDRVIAVARGPRPNWLPSHAWQISPSGDLFSLAFDGVDDFAFVPHNDVMNCSDAMTIEMWINPASQGVPGVLLAKALSGSIVCYSVELDASGRAVFKVFEESGAAFVQVQSESVFMPGEWKHLAAVYTGTAASVFVNGVSESQTVASGVVRVNTLAHLHIGSILADNAYKGMLDDVRLWSVSRTALQIAETYKEPLSGSEDGLEGYWMLSEGTGQMLADLSGNELHMTLGTSLNAEPFDPAWSSNVPGEQIYELIYEFGRPWQFV